MRYNFKRLPGREWYDTIRELRRRRVTFLGVESSDLYIPEKVNNVFNAYYNRTSSGCKLIYYDLTETGWKKRLRQISFSPKEIDPVRCVLTFKKIANSFGELLPFEPDKKYSNGVYTYFNKPYKGKTTVLDMNSAYLWALSQPLADWDTCTEIKKEDVVKGEYDFYSFENDLHCQMVYKLDYTRLAGASIWAGSKVYGYKASRHYVKTAEELYRLKCEVDKERYKNVANVAIGCMHKRSGKQNNTTLAASLYAFFAWHIDNLVAKFSDKGYNVIMVTTDSIKIQGEYNEEDNLVEIGPGLGQFKYEYSGEAEYITSGHYQEDKVKWKGKPKYMIDGNNICLFVENIEKELEVYEKYAIT